VAASSCEGITDWPAAREARAIGRDVESIRPDWVSIVMGKFLRACRSSSGPMQRVEWRHG
jgi:hypothetical protein